MKTASEWLTQYSETHRNTVNQRIHLVCVPMIFWSVLTLIWSLPAGEVPPLVLNWAFLAMVPVLAFYMLLGLEYVLLMLPLMMGAVTLNVYLESIGLRLLPIALGAFVLGWLGQFYGHHKEGRRPSFLQDLAFLLIGPVWTLRKLWDR